MPKKVILDVDPGIYDALVLCCALFDPEIEILAITSVGGNVPSQIAYRNLQAIVEYLDPPRLPRLGMGTEPENGLPVDGRHVHGIDGLGGANLPFADRRTQYPAEKVICDAIRSAPDQVTIIALGPLTNIARAFQRDPELPAMVSHLYITGGSYDYPGNITPAAEFNIFCDPAAAKYVFQSCCMKTLIPLDVTNRMKLTLGHMDQLPENTTKVGHLLRSIFMPAFRAYRQRFGIEGIYYHDMITYVAALHPELFEMQSAAVNIEVAGEYTRGMTIFDRRPVPGWRPNLEVALALQEEEVLKRVLSGIDYCAKCVEELQ